MRKAQPGDVYNMLTVIEEAEKFVQPSGQKLRSVICRCECGNLKRIRVVHLTHSRVKSCGCIQPERHGLSGSKLYNVWRGMKERCYGNHTIQPHLYKDKGITVCEEWRYNFTNFHDWAMANGYQYGLQIDRIENSDGYSPGNCRFVTPAENCNNREVTVKVNYNGYEYPFMTLVRLMGLEFHEATIRMRIKRGWDHQRAFDTPIRKGNYRTNSNNQRFTK